MAYARGLVLAVQKQDFEASQEDGPHGRLDVEGVRRICDVEATATVGSKMALKV